MKLADIYIEWVEDLGLSPVDILTVILEKKNQEIDDLKKENSDLRNRMAKYEN